MRLVYLVFNSTPAELRLPTLQPKAPPLGPVIEPVIETALELISASLFPTPARLPLTSRSVTDWTIWACAESAVTWC